MPTTLRTYNGSNGNQVFGQSIGIYFTVNPGYTLTVTDLGAFASGGVGVPVGVTITASLVNRAAPATMLGQVTFTNASPGTVDATNRVMTKSITPAVLVPGDYCVWVSGYTAAYQNYNSTQPAPGSAAVTSNYGGAITLGSDQYLLGTTMPNIADPAIFGGPTFFADASSGGGSTMQLEDDMLLISDDVIPYTPADAETAGQELVKQAELRYQMGWFANQDATVKVQTARGFDRTLTVKAGQRVMTKIKRVYNTGTTASTTIYVYCHQSG